MCLFLLHSLQPSHKQSVKASQAVGFPLLLLEDALADLSQAEGTHKVLRVKFAAERWDTASRDGLTAAAAQSALPGVEVEGAERSSIQLHETAISKGLQTILDSKNNTN